MKVRSLIRSCFAHLFPQKPETVFLPVGNSGILITISYAPDKVTDNEGHAYEYMSQAADVRGEYSVWRTRLDDGFIEVMSAPNWVEAHWLKVTVEPKPVLKITDSSEPLPRWVREQGF